MKCFRFITTNRNIYTYKPYKLHKKPEVDPVAKAHFIKHFIKDPTKEKERESDYDRQIRKCYSNPKNRLINAKTVPQLGE